MTDKKKNCHHHWVWRAGSMKNHCVDCDEYCKPSDEPEPEHDETIAWMAMDFLFTRIGSWTHARWDQHLRDRYGDEKADRIIERLGYEKMPAGQPPRPREVPSASPFVHVSEPLAPKACIFCHAAGHTLLGSMCTNLDQCHARVAADLEKRNQENVALLQAEQQPDLTRARIAFRTAFDAQTVEGMRAALDVANGILNPSSCVMDAHTTMDEWISNSGRPAPTPVLESAYNPAQLAVGDIVRPTNAHADEGDLVGVVTGMMPPVVANPYMVKWSSGTDAHGLERKDLAFVMRPPPGCVVETPMGPGYSIESYQAYAADVRREYERANNAESLAKTLQKALNEIGTADNAAQRAYEIYTAIMAHHWPEDYTTIDSWWNLNANEKQAWQGVAATLAGKPLVLTVASPT